MVASTHLAFQDLLEGELLLLHKSLLRGPGQNTDSGTAGLPWGQSLHRNKFSHVKGSSLRLTEEGSRYS